MSHEEETDPLCTPLDALAHPEDQLPSHLASLEQETDHSTPSEPNINTVVGNTSGPAFPKKNQGGAHATADGAQDDSNKDDYKGNVSKDRGKGVVEKHDDDRPVPKVQASSKLPNKSPDERVETHILANASSQSRTLQRPQNHLIFTTNPPEALFWDVLQEPLSDELVKRIPLEIWAMILCCVPPTRLGRLLTVSKTWKAWIEKLPLWREICTGCEMMDPARGTPSLMKLVIGHMVLICDLCLQRSYRLGQELPLPVRRPDLLGLVWMCKSCRDEYRATYPEVMKLSDRAFKDEDVYRQGPCQKVVHRRPRRYRGWSGQYDRGWGVGGYHDDWCESDDDWYDSDEESDDMYDEDYDQGDYDIIRPTWTNKADPNSWLNKVLNRGRSRLLKTMLGMYGLQLRTDSHLCSDFINGTQYDPQKIVATMREMAWFFKSTDYAEYNKNGSENAKAQAISDWTLQLFKSHREGSLEVFKTTDVPDSLWPQIEFALKRHIDYSQRMKQLAKQREAEWKAKLEQEPQALKMEQEETEAMQKQSAGGGAENGRSSGKDESADMATAAVSLSENEGVKDEEEDKTDLEQEAQDSEDEAGQIAAEGADSDDDDVDVEHDGEEEEEGYHDYEEDYPFEDSDESSEEYGEGSEVGHDEAKDRAARLWVRGQLMAKYAFKVDCAIRAGE